jgi:hypothetical protein
MNSRYGKSFAGAAAALLGILPPAARAYLVGLAHHRHRTHQAYFPPSAGARKSASVPGAEPSKIGLTRAEYFALISADGPRAFSAALKKIARDRGLPVKRGAHAGYDWYYLGDRRD